MKKVICLLVIGEKYQAVFSKNKEQFTRYATTCGADLEIIETPPDPGFTRSLLFQKLLIPSLLSSYDLALFIDVDIIISRGAPSAFEDLPAGKSFAAVLDPRSTPEFNETWKHIERIPKETTEDYFSSRHFTLHKNLQGSINGGVFLCRPAEIADLFKGYYFSEHNQGTLNSFEETPMAYLTQVNDSFYPMDPKFNVQVLYRLKGTEEGLKVVAREQKLPGWFRRLYYKRSGHTFYPVKMYKKLIQRELQHAYFLHFAGSFPGF